ncbi:MAG: insulinase family protein [Betaproteobacteria bacterium]|nr:insulinase family protein [Betaproteobacteria bacterium]MBI2959841.1 insulinase family protein [Betaproteobacteria bacterium]
MRSAVIRLGCGNEARRATAGPRARSVGASLCAYALLGVALAILCAQAAANPAERRLRNGLRIIVKEDRRAPTLVQQVWYRAGSMDESVGTTGVAHVLEHLMFKGTSSLASGEFSRRVAEAGGRENAFTATDHTVYFQQMHRDKLGLAMALEADRMANLIVEENEFPPELKVVMEERRLRTDDRPRSLLYERLMATAFTSHPYQWPVVGWMGDLQNMTYRDAANWYRRWYAPNNAVVVIVGDVDAREVFRLAERTYGRLPARKLPQRKSVLEPPQRGMRQVTVEAPAAQAYVMLGYKVPVLRRIERDWEPHALAVLAALLDGGNPSARLNQSLVRERRVADHAAAGYNALARGPGMFCLEGAVAQGKSAAALEAALREQVERIAAEEPSGEELGRVKTKLVAQRIYRRDSIFSQAMEIGLLESAGLTWRDSQRIIDGLRSVSPAQVREVAAKHFIEDNLTVAVLDPQPLDARQLRAAVPALRH